MNGRQGQRACVRYAEIPSAEMPNVNTTLLLHDCCVILRASMACAVAAARAS